MISAALAFALMAAPQEAAVSGDAAEPVVINQTTFRPIGFVPAGWKLYDKVDGDLDGDGRLDSALIIQRNDPAGVISNPDGFGYDSYDSNPRILLVTIQDKLGQYQLVGRSDEIVPDRDSPTIDDPYEAMLIKDGKLHLDLRFFASAGTWSMFSRSFQFRWDGKAMALIGFDMSYVHRGSGEMQQASVNYLTGRRQDSSGNISDDEPNWVWSDLPEGYKPKLGDIGNGFDFEG
ncbi:hypothetical protein [Altererythrobacter sp. ZODW24]|uniref:hypothetical protein n=1 Tax=Altererythrobacter sp. ZODW24 TaxID=2185142 RepID=UPI000DF80B34|nr:hypothetical protein [Altererythrobacter sp. ZODW24]